MTAKNAMKMMTEMKKNLQNQIKISELITALEGSQNKKGSPKLKVEHVDSLSIWYYLKNITGAIGGRQVTEVDYKLLQDVRGFIW